MKKIIGMILAILMTLMVISACADNSGATDSGAPGSAAASPTSVKPSGPIKLGINMELSGAMAAYGEDTVAGIELAIAQLNAAGGINGAQVELVKYDNKSDCGEAAALATKLMTEDGVLAVLGPAASDTFGAEVPIAMQNGVPVISGSATVADVTADASGVKDYAFRICYTNDAQGVAIANFARNNLSVSKAVIMKDGTGEYGKDLAESFTAAFKAGGGTIVSDERYAAGDTDFSVMLTNIAAMDYDMIFIPGYYAEAGRIIKQVRALGITVPILGADGFDMEELVELAGKDAANNIYFSNHFTTNDPSTVAQEFVAAFREKYDAEPNAMNALGYDLARFTCEGIRRAAAYTGEGVKNALATTSDFEGVTGTFSIDENHNAVKSFVITEMQGGELVGSVRAGA